MRALFAVALGATLLAGCGSNRSCKDACGKIQGCSIIEAGLTCDDGSTCDDTAGTCAECVNDTSCDDLMAGKCQSHCPGVQFTKY